MKQKYRVLIAEDHTILREGLRSLLSSDPSIEIAGEASNGGDAVRLATTLAPDLALMDISMPGMTGIEAIMEIKKRTPEIRVLALTVHKTEEYVHETLQAGADGYVLKDATYAELMLAVKAVLNGKTYLSPAISEHVVNGFLGGGRNAQTQSTWDALTHREREVLKLVAEGHSNKHIADYLCLSVKTVEKHRSNLMRKLDMHNASTLTAFAISKGLVT